MDLVRKGSSNSGRGRRPIFAEWYGSENPIQRLVLNGGVENARSHSNAGFARSAKDLAQDAFGDVRGVRETESRGEVIVSGGRQGFRNPRVAGIHQTRRRVWILGGLEAGNERDDFVLRVIPRRAVFPTQSQVESQVGAQPYRVLRVNAAVPASAIEDLRCGLRIRGWCAKQIVGHVVAGFASAEAESPDEAAAVAIVHLVIPKIRAQLDGVAAVNL